MVLNQRAQVWNDSDKPYKEDFKGVMMEVPPRAFIEMDSQEASEFLAQFVAPKRDGMGTFLNSKPLRKVIVPSSEGVKNETVPEDYCIICNKQFGSKGFLAAHFSKMHRNLIPVEEKHDPGTIGNPNKESV
jgi:hypothetical protein